MFGAPKTAHLGAAGFELLKQLAAGPGWRPFPDRQITGVRIFISSADVSTVIEFRDELGAVVARYDLAGRQRQ